MMVHDVEEHFLNLFQRAPWSHNFTEYRLSSGLAHEHLIRKLGPFPQVPGTCAVCTSYPIEHDSLSIKTRK